MRILVYWPFTRTRGIVYLLLSIIVLPAYMLNLATALSLIGLSSYYSALVGFLITIISLVMSSIHVVIYEVNTTVYTPAVTSITLFGMTFKIPTFLTQARRTAISINA
ncbi:MAG: hypothetical protein RXR39_05555, partial [Caldivirga sp.]